MLCYLHIGPPKTGSSSIQKLLNKEKQKFADAGFFIPTTDHSNMSEFHFASKDTIRKTRAAARLNLTRGNLDESQATIRENLSEQLSSAKTAGFQSVVISSEGLASLKDDGIASLKEWLSKYCEEFQVVMVLRRQDARSVSLYRNKVTLSNRQKPGCLNYSASMDYGKIIGRWANHFGRESLRPILFPDSVTEKRDLLVDFCNVIGAKGIYSKKDAKDYRLNTAVDGRAVELLRLLNIEFPRRSGRAIPPGRKMLEKKIRSIDWSPMVKIEPSAEEAREFYQQFREDNEDVRANFFPDRKTLFSEDFSKYPEEPNYPEPDLDFVIRLFGEVIYDKEIVIRSRKKIAADKAALKQRRRQNRRQKESK